MPIKHSSKKYSLTISTYILMFFMGGCFRMQSSEEINKQNDNQICQNIARDIEKLKLKYPQLKEFDPAKNLNKQRCKISYTYKCHDPDRRSGWAGGVPNPDPDGIWFYIGLWDENDPQEKMAQINTQPVIPLWYINGRRVTYLILEGEKTNSVSEQIFEILRKHGLQEPVN